MLIEEGLDGFFFRNKSLSPQTQIWYERRLTAFMAWCKEHSYTELEQVSARVISQYLDEMSARSNLNVADKPLSSYTINAHARIIRTWANWLEATEEFEEHVQPRLGKRIPMPKIQRKSMSIFTIPEIKKLLSACDDDSSWPDIAVRNRAIVSLLIDTGIRASELTGLTLDCCFLHDEERPYIRIMGKGGKEREVGLGNLSLAALEAYLQQYRLSTIPDPKSGRHILANIPKKQKHVFIGLKYEPLTSNGLQELLERLGKRAGVPDCHPHKFRHSFACHFIMGNCGDLHSLSKLLGHSDCSLTSSVYLSAVQSMQARRNSKSVLDCSL